MTLHKHKNNSNNKINWFNLSNYDACERFTAADWCNEIIQRVLLHLFYFNDGSYYDIQHYISEVDKSEGQNKIEIIREFGLIKNAKLPKRRLVNSSLKRSIQYQNSNKKFISDISEFDAYNFLATSALKRQIESDLKKISSTQETTQDLMKVEKLYKKYQKPMSDFENRDYDYGTRYLSICLDASDETLSNQFKLWLNEQRKEYSFSEFNISKSTFNDWHQKKILAYWDIVTLSRIDNTHLSNALIGDLIYPAEEVDVGERVRKVTQPQSREIISLKTIEILDAQAKAE